MREKKKTVMFLSRDSNVPQNMLQSEDDTDTRTMSKSKTKSKTKSIPAEIVHEELINVSTADKGV